MSTSTDPDGREHAIPALRELLLAGGEVKTGQNERFENRMER